MGGKEGGRGYLYQGIVAVLCGATRFLRNLDRIFEKKWVSFLEEFLGRVHSDAPLAGERRFFIKSHLSAPQNTVRSAHGAGTGG